MYVPNPSIENIIGNIVRMSIDKPGNKLMISRSKLEPTYHPLIALVDDIDYQDKGVLDVFQHGYLEHVRIDDTAHGFKNIVPNGPYKGEIIWCTGTDDLTLIDDTYNIVNMLTDEERSNMNIDMVNCGKLNTWSEIITLIKSSDSQLRIGCVDKPNTIYHVGVDTYKTLSMKIPKEIPTPVAFSGLDLSEPLWFIYKGMQPNVRINSELRSYRVVYL